MGSSLAHQIKRFHTAQTTEPNRLLFINEYAHSYHRSHTIRNKNSNILILNKMKEKRRYVILYKKGKISFAVRKVKNSGCTFITKQS